MCRAPLYFPHRSVLPLEPGVSCLHLQEDNSAIQTDELGVGFRISRCYKRDDYSERVNNKIACILARR